MFKRDFDVFLAYHGTYASKGSREVADLVYKALEENGVKVFYFPASGRDSYKANIIEVMKSKTFLLICNENIARQSNQKIDQSVHYELSTEIDAFYALTQFGTDVTVQDSKILVLGDYQGKQGEESKLHELFANRTHFFYHEDTVFSEVLNWVKERVNLKLEEELWKKSQTSNEILEVFGKRSSMSQRCNLPQMVASAKSIKCVGISNSEMTIKMDIEAIKFAMNRGAEIELIFLDPNSKFTKERESEEDLRENRIKNITAYNIEHALDVNEKIDTDYRLNYQLMTYDMQPRMNMIIIDDYIILQYYANKVPGMSNPCFLLQEQPEGSPLYDFCIASYDVIRQSAKLIED